jgi:hypothetical protein
VLASIRPAAQCRSVPVNSDVRQHRYALQRCKEKLRATVYRLAVAEGNVRERLKGAHWYLRQLAPEDLPPDHREEFADILHELTWRGTERGPDGYVWRSAIDHTLARMRNGTGRRIAERLAALSHSIP